MTAVADRLRAAADALLEQGWTQDYTRNVAGEMCPVGAIIYCKTTAPAGIQAYVPNGALLADLIASEAVNVFARWLVAEGPLAGLAGADWVDAFRVDAVTHWNDKMACTRAEVVAALRKAAAWHEQEDAPCAG
jgi:hypothetical protein